MNRIEQKKYFKLSFSVGVETPEDVDWVREQMQGLEKEPLIMKCFQNVTVSRTQIRHNDWANENNAFSIYLRKRTINL